MQGRSKAKKNWLESGSYFVRRKGFTRIFLKLISAIDILPAFVASAIHTNMESCVTCEVCEGKGIVPSEKQSIWQPAPWDGNERRQDERGEKEKKFNEVAAPLYMTCEACQGLGRLLPGFISKLK